MSAADRWRLANDASELTRTGPFAIPSLNDFEDLVGKVQELAPSGALTLVVEGARVGSVPELLEAAREFSSVFISAADQYGSLWSVQLSTTGDVSGKVWYATHRESADLRQLLQDAWNIASLIEDRAVRAEPGAPVVVTKRRSEIWEDKQRERQAQREDAQRAKDRIWNVGGAIAGGVFGALAGWAAGWFASGGT